MKRMFLISMIFTMFNCAVQRGEYYIKTSISPADSSMKVAIINENVDSWWVSSIAYRVLITELMDVGFKVIERSNLEQVIKEQKFTESMTIKKDKNEKEESQNFTLSVLDKNSIQEIGNMLGVDYLIITYVVPRYDLKMALGTFRLVNVYSGEIVTSTTVYSPMDGSEVDVLMKQVANDIMYVSKNGKGIVRNRLGISPPSSGTSNGQMRSTLEKTFRVKVDNE
jgi:curli biogenesis system outer membrane secretion channel CsgG